MDKCVGAWVPSDPWGREKAGWGQKVGCGTVSTKASTGSSGSLELG